MTALFPWPDKVYEEYELVRETDDEQILIDIAKNHPFHQVPFEDRGFAFPCRIFRTCQLQ